MPVPLVAAGLWAGAQAAGILARIDLQACAFKTLTGFPCAACGTTRAFKALLGGSVGAAAFYQPLATAVMIGAVLGPMLYAMARAAGVALCLELSGDEKAALRFTTVYLLLVNWLYLIDTGI